MRKKRYEIMTPTEIMKVFDLPCINSGGGDKCNSCKVYLHSLTSGKECTCKNEPGMLCSDIAKKHLNEDIDVQKRWESLTSDEAVNRMYSVYKLFYSDGSKSLEDFLCEWVEVNKEFEKDGI